MYLVGTGKEEVTGMTVPALVALVVGLGLGLLLICLAVFLFNKRSPPAESGANSNRSSVYFPLEPIKVSSGYFTTDNSSSFNPEPVVMRQNSGRKVKQMTTFGKGQSGQSGQSDIENSIKKYLDSVHYEASPIIITQQGKNLSR